MLSLAGLHFGRTTGCRATLVDCEALEIHTEQFSAEFNHDEILKKYRLTSSPVRYVKNDFGKPLQKGIW